MLGCQLVGTFSGVWVGLVALKVLDVGTDSGRDLKGSRAVPKRP